MKLKEIRILKGLNQEQAATILGITRRTYAKYENGEKPLDIKYKFMCQVLQEYGKVDEEHGILSLEEIKNQCLKVFEDKDVEFAYLFGSYAKGTATENSDVDILVSTTITGLDYYELVETLRENLKKKVDLLNISQLNNNQKLVQEILKDGVKIYG